MRIIINLALSFMPLLLRCEGCMEEEREALLQLKSSINSPVGTAFSNWYGEDCCHWDDVECDASTSHITKIRFKFLRSEESGTGPWYPNATLFAQFKDLQELHLPGNQIRGFTSPNDLHKLKNLQKLDLHQNFIENVNYLCWGNLPTLYLLDLSTNHLKGHIPKCICGSQSFSELILDHNQLEGNIDACFSNMSSLELLSLSDNHFSGLVSLSIFANLSRLCYLDISYNAHLEIETESPTWFPSFNLNQLKLAGCNLNNRSGRIVPSFISTQYHLQVLDLSYNSLVGSIPSWLFYNVTSELLIRGNNFSGFFPKSHRNMSSQLTALGISDNSLHGPFPEDINMIFPELLRLTASMNSFTGIIPQSVGEMKRLQRLDLSSNNLHGEVPHGMGNMTSLEFLKLSSNNLQGEALPRNFSLPDLRWLSLDRNDLSGSFPDSLSKSSSLQILSIYDNDFSGELSTKLPVLPSLNGLILRGNRFQGQIPLQLCQMKRLHILDLSENDLSGEILTCLNNITSWTEDTFSVDPGWNPWVGVGLWYKSMFLTFEGRILHYIYAMDISSNKLTGAIPPKMTELKAIVSLNMSNNLLSGKIPANFSHLTNLESLDLSRNKLFGGLPPQLADLEFLSDFDVSLNNLWPNTRRSTICYIW